MANKLGNNAEGEDGTVTMQYNRLSSQHIEDKFAYPSLHRCTLMLLLSCASGCQRSSG